VELLQYLYVHDNNLFSFSHCLFAQDGDDILGLVVGYDWQTKQSEQLSTGYLMIKYLGLQFSKPCQHFLNWMRRLVEFRVKTIT